MNRLIEYWKELTGLGLSLAAAFLTYFAKLGNQDQDLNLYYSVIMLFVSHVFVAQLFRGIQLRDLEERIAKLYESNVRVSWNQTVLGSVAANLTTLAASDRIIASTALFAIERIAQDVRVVRDGSKIEIDGRGYAVAAYSKFWEALAEFQRSRGSEKPMIARMTHTGDIASWLEEYSSSMSSQHRTFHEHGGRAFRIIVDPRQPGSDPRTYLRLMEMMRRDNVAVAYLTLEEVRPTLRPVALEADFCVTDDPPYVVRWIRKDNHGLEERRLSGITATLSTKKFGDHMIEWSELLSAIEHANYRAYYSDDAVIGALQEHREHFIRSVPDMRGTSGSDAR